MDPRPTPGYDLDACRAQFPILASHVPMNNCSQAPQSVRTRAAAERYLDSWNRSGMDWDAWLAEVEGARATFARLINAAPDEVAICSSVSEATSALATAIDFRGPRNGVVLSSAEFPTVGHAWLAQERRGARVTWAPTRGDTLGSEDFETHVDERTAVVSACHGWYLNGTVRDVGALARVVHARGAMLFVDAYQTLGAAPLDVRATAVDFVASGTLKFLMGIPGIAFLYIRHDRLDALEPLVTGWFGRAHPMAFDATRLDWAGTARRFDTGTPPIINACVARAGMDVLLDLGLPRVHAWHRVLSARLAEGGQARGLRMSGVSDPACKTASTAFVVDDAHAVERALLAHGIIASARGPVLRLAPHAYSTLDDVDRALDRLREVVDPA